MKRLASFAVLLTAAILFLSVAYGLAAGLGGTTTWNAAPEPTGGTIDYVTDTLTHQVQTPFPTQPALGGTWHDTVLGGTVRRVSSDHTASENYTCNCWINADNTMYLNTADKTVRSTTTGATLYSGIPWGSPSFDVGWSPIDPNVYYYWGSDASLRQRNVVTGVNTVIHTFPSTLQSAGGSVNFVDATDNYFIVEYGN